MMDFNEGEKSKMSRVGGYKMATDIIPRKEPQKVTYEQYQKYTPEKIEVINNNLFFSEQERINMLMLLMLNIGLDTVVQNLPRETVIELRKILN